MTTVEAQLRLRRDRGRKLLMPYLTGGVTPEWTGYLCALADAGADAIEVGIPFSDPTLDGVTIQEASGTALALGATTGSILADLSRSRIGVPVVVSTYANLALRRGADRFCRALAEAGVQGLIVPDLPLEESASTGAAASAANVDLALLASPATPPQRLREIADRSRGFIYAVSLMGTTGEREQLAASAARLARRLRRVTDRPVFLGFGISTPAQAAAAARDADGVIVGAALMRRLLDGADPAEVGEFVRSLRAALDSVPAEVPANAGD